MNENWYTSVPRLITIVVAGGVYLVALYTLIRKTKRLINLPPSSVPKEPAVSYAGVERRVYPRINLGISIRYKTCVYGDGVQVFKEGKARDISEGGLLLETNDKLEVKDKLELKLKLPFLSHFMLFRGIVTWTKEIEQGKWYNYGIAILEIDPNDRKRIAKFIASQKTD